MKKTPDMTKLTQTAVDQTRSAIDLAAKQADEMRTRFDSIIKGSFPAPKLSLPSPRIPTPDLPGIVESVTGYTLVTRTEIDDLEDRLGRAEKALAERPAPRKTATRKTAKKATARKTAPKATAASK